MKEDHSVLDWVVPPVLMLSLGTLLIGSFVVGAVVSYFRGLSEERRQISSRSAG